MDAFRNQPRPDPRNMAPNPETEGDAAPPSSNTRTSPCRAFIVGHAVRDFDEWHSIFRRSVAPHFRDLGLHYLVMGRSEDTDDDGRPCMVMIGLYPSSAEKGVSDALKFDRPPYREGETDLLGKRGGVASRPVAPNYRADVHFDTGHELCLDLNEDDEDVLMWFVGHGVRDYHQWIHHFSAYPHPPSTSGIIRTVGGRLPDREKDDVSEIATALVMNVCKKSYESKNREFLNFDFPPFVGGADWIAQGSVVLPFEPLSMITVEYEESWEDYTSLESNHAEEGEREEEETSSESR